MRRQTSSSSSQSSLPFLSRTKEGASIRVRLQPRSSRDQLEGVKEGSLRIRLTAPPVEGEANRALIEFLSRITGIRKSSFSISSGQRSRDKLVSVDSTIEELEAAFSRVIPSI